MATTMRKKRRYNRDSVGRTPKQEIAQAFFAKQKAAAEKQDRAPLSPELQRLKEHFDHNYGHGTIKAKYFIEENLETLKQFYDHGPIAHQLLTADMDPHYSQLKATVDELYGLLRPAGYPYKYPVSLKAYVYIPARHQATTISHLISSYDSNRVLAVTSRGLILAHGGHVIWATVLNDSVKPMPADMRLWPDSIQRLYITNTHSSLSQGKPRVQKDPLVQLQRCNLRPSKVYVAKQRKLHEKNLGGEIDLSFSKDQ